MRMILWQNGFEIGSGVKYQNFVPNPTVRFVNNLNLQNSVNTASSETFGEMIYTKKELVHAKNVSAEFAPNYGAWHFKAMGGYLRNITTDETTIHCFIGTHYVSPEKQTSDIANATCSNTAAENLSTQGYHQFKSEYGSHFISGYVKGALFLGYLKITMYSKEDAVKFSSQLGARALQLLTTDVLTEISRNANVQTQSIEFKVSVFGLNNGFIAPQISTLDNLRTAHAQFSEQIRNNNNLGPILAICQPIEELTEISQYLNEFPTEKRIHQLDNQIEELELSGLNEIEYRNLRTTHTLTRTFFQIGSQSSANIEIRHDDVYSYDTWYEITADRCIIIDRNTRSSLTGRTYYGHFEPWWNAGVAACYLELRFFGPEKDYPESQKYIQLAQLRQQRAIAQVERAGQLHPAPMQTILNHPNGMGQQISTAQVQQQNVRSITYSGTGSQQIFRN